MNTEEGAGQEVMELTGGMVDVSMKAVQVPPAKALDGVGTSTKVGCPSDSTPSE